MITHQDIDRIYCPNIANMDKLKVMKKVNMFFIILLILTMPIYTASVFAADESTYSIEEKTVLNSGLFSSISHISESTLLQKEENMPLYSINSVNVSGKDGINGVRRQLQDHANISVILDNDGDGISANQVWIGTATHFESCSPSSSGRYQCLAREPATGETDSSNTVVSYTINYFDDGYIISLNGVNPDAALKSSTGTGTIVVDSIAPTISSATATPSRIGAGNVTLSYTIADTACSQSSCTNLCTGIKEVSASLGLTILNNSLVNTAQCAYSGTLTFNSASLSQGNNTITLIAKDRFDQSSQPVSVDVFLDTQQPTINNLVVKDLQGNNITYVPSSRTSVRVYVDVHDSELNPSMVFGDFSNIISTSNRATATCHRIADGYECFFNLNADLTSVSNQAITVNATDNFGNTATQQLNLGLTVDGVRPIVTSVTTNRMLGQQSVIGGNTTIIVNFQETGSGFGKKNVWLDLGSLGLGIKKADRCTATACYFDNISTNVASGERTISVTANSADDVGNLIANGTYFANVKVDSDIPIVQQVVVQGFHNGNPTLYPATGDTLKITATVAEDTNLTASANLSIINGNENLSTMCQRLNNTNIWGCIFQNVLITRTGPFNSSITLTFTDFAGNKVIREVPVRILGNENITTPNYWTNSVVCSPNPLDRETAPFVNHRVYCRVSLSSPNAELLYLEKGPCSGNGSSYLQSNRLIKVGGGDTNPFDNNQIIELVLARNEYRINSVNLNCPLTIRSKVGDNAIILPEIENVSITIEFYNLPLGEFSKQVDEKIDEVKKKTEGLWKIIGMLRKLFFYAEKVCQLLGLYHKVTLAYHLFDKKVTALAIAFKGTPAAAALEPAQLETCIGSNLMQDTGRGLAKVLTPFCNFVTCSGSKDKDSDKKGTSGGIIGRIGGVFNSMASWDGLAGDALDDLPFTGGLDYKHYADSRHNLLVAILTGCIPGIIYGIDKYRQIECGYGVCLQEAVKGNGVPISTCDETKEYQTCKYIYGEIFAVLPWTAFFNYMMGIIKTALSDPLAALGIGLSLACKAECVTAAGDSTAHLAWKFSSLGGLCSFTTWMNLFGEIIGEVRSIMNPDEWKIQGDMCAILDEGSSENQDDED